MLKMFEKLINEHGSSTILKERLELFSDKYSMLEEKLKVFEQKNNMHENENEKLKTQLSQAEKEIERLKEIIKVSAEKTSLGQLEEVQEKILKYLFEVGDEVDLIHLCSQLALDKSTAEYHLNILEEGNFIYTRYYQGDWVSGESGYTVHEIDQEGRKYVIKKLNR